MRRIDVIFRNKHGEVCFSGRGRGKWRIIDISGLGLAPRSAEVVRYAGEDGQETLSLVRNARIITMSVEAAGANPTDRAIAAEAAMRILNHSGTIIIRTHKERCAKCYLSDCTEGERHGAFRTYVFQFTCDKPYFEDLKETTVFLYKREDLLRDGFIIGNGVVLTRRACGGTILNGGDERAEGKIRLLSAQDNSVEIINKTTGGGLKINMEGGSEYVIDLKERTITDGNGNSRLDILAPESYLSDMYLEAGRNEIEFVCSSEAQLEATYIFRKRYAEACD